MDAFLLPMDVIHHGYALDDETMKKKQRNLELLYQELDTTPDKGYIYFQIGQSLMTLEGATKAIEAYEKGMECIDNFGKYYVPELIMSLASTYVSADRISDALALMEQYAPHFNTAKYVYAYANTLWATEQILQALGNYIKVIMMKDARHWEESCRAATDELYRFMRHLARKKWQRIFIRSFLHTMQIKKAW